MGGYQCGAERDHRFWIDLGMGKGEGQVSVSEQDEYKAKELKLPRSSRVPHPRRLAISFWFGSHRRRQTALGVGPDGLPLHP